MKSISLFLFTVFSLWACDTFNPKETIPSYILIDSMPFKGRPSTGGNSQNITDVWVYANNQIVGVFTPDSTKPIPVLAEGQVTIAVSAGVFTDAVKGNRVYYPFFKQYSEITTLSKGKITKVHPFATYPDNLNIPFTWYQDFEKSDSGCNKGASGTASITRTSHEAGTDTSLYGKYFALIKANTADDILMLTHTYFLPLRQNGMPVYLELDYQSTCDVTVGLEGTKGVGSDFYPDLVLRPVSKWTKVYVSLSDEAEKFLQGTKFRFFIKSTEAPGFGQSFSVDNLKLINY